MDFAFSEEQEAFRDGLRRFLAERWSPAEVRRLLPTPEGYDRGVWKQMATELGATGLAIPEACGGQGFGFLELVIALEEMGRVLAGGPYFATVCLGAQALRNGATEEEQRSLLPDVASGAALATLAVAEDAAEVAPDTIACEAHREGEGFRLRGAKRFVVDGQNAELILVAAREPGTRGTEGIGLFAVRSGAAGLAVEPLEALDLTRRQAHLELADVPARRLGGAGSAWPKLARTLEQARIGLAAEMLGGTAACLEASVEYAKTRVQFARPIGSFQAIKHKAAEVLLELESARSVAYWAGWVAAQEDPEAGALAEAASLAKACCADAYRRAAAENIQIHGGMGTTWEHDAHLHYRRARASDVLLGDATAQRARLADRLGFRAARP